MTKIDELRERKIPMIKISQAKDLMPQLARYACKRQEHFVVAILDGGHQVLRIKLVTVGLLNRTLIHPREVFRPAILESAAAVILVHSHPSGNLDPSREDRDITRRLVESGQLIGIPVLDHLIISKQGYYSFQEAGMLPTSTS